MNKCVFLDRDGVINKDHVDYAYTLDRFEILPGVREAVALLKESGYYIVIVTNQSGIAKGVFHRSQMQECHDYLQQELHQAIDKIYYAPNHPSYSESLHRKPDSLMLERGIARFDVDVKQSWMVGDKKTDMIPGKKVGVRTIQVGGKDDHVADFVEKDLLAAVKRILMEA